MGPSIKEVQLYSKQAILKYFEFYLEQVEA
jgi:hypothetical protein